MAKQIIVLTKSTGPGGDQLINCVFWLAVSAGNQIPLPAAVSEFRGASAAELAAIKAGSVIELPYASQYPATFTNAQIEAALQTAYTAAVNALAAHPNPNTLYGAFFDGTAWNASAGVPPGATSNGYQFGSKISSTSGDNIVIPAVAGQAVTIWQMKVAAAAAVTVQIKDGATVIDAFVFGAAGNGPPLPFTGVPWYVTSTGNGFTINLSAAAQVLLNGWYTQA